MDSDLMGAACFQPTLDEGYIGIGEPFQNRVPRSRWTPVDDDRLAGCISRGTPKRGIDHAFFGHHLTPDKCEISAHHRTGRQLPSERNVCRTRSGNHQKSAGSLIQPMNNTWPRWIVADANKIGKASQQALDQSSG